MNNAICVNELLYFLVLILGFPFVILAFLAFAFIIKIIVKNSYRILPSSRIRKKRR